MRVPFERRINPRRQNRVERIKWRKSPLKTRQNRRKRSGFRAYSPHCGVNTARDARTNVLKQTGSSAAEFPRISTRQEQPNNLRASWRESPGRLNYAQEHAHPYRRIRSHPNAVCFDTRAVNSLLHPENLRTSRVGITRHSAESQPSAIRARNPRITRMSLGSRQCPLRRFRGYTADRQGQRHART